MDPRSTFGTAQIADTSLKGRFEAQTYVTPTIMQMAVPILDITHEGTPQLQRQLLLGDMVEVLTPDAPRSLVRDANSAYVGWADTSALTPYTATNAIVTARSTFLFAEAHFKAPHPVPISMGSRVTIKEEGEKFYQISSGHFVPKTHLSTETAIKHPLTLLGSMIGAPYLWGGNSAFGIDCSGLVQMLCRLADIPCPGDSDQQAYGLGVPLAMDAPIMPGDLWFWKGHVALSWDTDTLLHANAHHMATAFEPLQDAITRIEAAGDGPVAARRRALY